MVHIGHDVRLFNHEVYGLPGAKGVLASNFAAWHGQGPNGAILIFTSTRNLFCMYSTRGKVQTCIHTDSTIFEFMSESFETSTTKR